MPGSLALAAYLALARLRRGHGEDEAARPEGPLLWVHADDPARLPALAALADRLLREDGVPTLLTLPSRWPLPPSPGRMLLRHAPRERLGAVRSFFDRWRPDLLLWAGGGLCPALIAQAPGPRLLIEGAPEPQLLARGARWPGLARAVVPLFDHALVTGEAEAERLSRAGLAGDRLEVLPRLDAPAAVLPCNERERRDLAQTLEARPVWLAADLPLSELPAVIAAHRLACRGTHRLLLIIAPRAADEAPAMAAQLAGAGLRVKLRADGDEPDSQTQVYLAEGTGEMGLWLRLAPLAYLGGTLPGGPGGRHPFEAAALGSALLHGPVTAPHQGFWSRLDAVGAARTVRNGLELGRHVEALLAPDQVAAMAHGAWDVATQGAEVANRVADLVRERLRPRSGQPAAQAGA